MKGIVGTELLVLEICRLCKVGLLAKRRSRKGENAEDGDGDADEDANQPRMLP